MNEIKFDEKAFKKWHEACPGAFGYTPEACARWQFDQLKAVIEVLQSDLKDAEKREIHLESCVERLHDLIQEAQFIAPISILEDSINIYNEAEILVRDKDGKPVRGKDAEG